MLYFAFRWFPPTNDDDVNRIAICSNYVQIYTGMHEEMSTRVTVWYIFIADVILSVRIK